MTLLTWYAFGGMGICGTVAVWSWTRLQREDARSRRVQNSIGTFINLVCVYVVGLIVLDAIEGATGWATVSFVLLLLPMIWLLRRHAHDRDRYRL